MIITDNKAPMDLVEKAARFGIEILIVNPDDNTIEKHFNPA